VKSQLKSFGFAQDNDLGINTITRKNLKEALTMLNSNTDLQKKLVDSSLIEVDAQLNNLKREYAQIQSEKPDDKRLEVLSKKIEALESVRDGELNEKQKIDEEIRKQLATQKSVGTPPTEKLEFDLLNEYQSNRAKMASIKAGEDIWLPEEATKGEAIKMLEQRNTEIIKRYEELGGDLGNLGIFDDEQAPEGQPKIPDVHEAMPPPQEHKGRTIINVKNGKRYKSNGKEWIAQ